MHDASFLFKNVLKIPSPKMPDLNLSLSEYLYDLIIFVLFFFSPLNKKDFQVGWYMSSCVSEYQILANNTLLSALLPVQQDTTLHSQYNYIVEKTTALTLITFVPLL